MSRPEAALERQLEADLQHLSLAPAARDWISDNIHAKLDAGLRERSARRHGLEQSLADSGRESDALLTLKLRGQVDDEAFERRRLGLLDRQAKLRLQLDQPAATPEEMLKRVDDVLRFSVSLPRAFR